MTKLKDYGIIISVFSLFACWIYLIFTPLHGIFFPDACRRTMIAVTEFHDITFTLVLFIFIYVAIIRADKWNRAYLKIYFPASYAYQLEYLWGLLPASVLCFLAMPSLFLLYKLDAVSNPLVTAKVTGHQWYWSYSTGPNCVDSYMVPEEDLEPGDLRLLEVDNRLILPYGVGCRILISSEDVLHSWAVPSLGLKADAVPGRLNILDLVLLKVGVFYGQCSEICGANHRFMPICVESVHPHLWW